LTFTAGELEISPISKNAIFLLLFIIDNLLQAHSAKYNIQYQSEFHIAERACKRSISEKLTKGSTALPANQLLFNK